MPRNQSVFDSGRLTKVAKVFTRDTGIQVVFDGNRCYFDGNMIVLPENADDFTGDPKRWIDGALDHENQHAKWEQICAKSGRVTAMDIVKKIANSGHPHVSIRSPLFNALEDIRIERLAEHIGERQNIAAVHASLDDMFNAKTTEEIEAYPSIKRLGLGILSRVQSGRYPDNYPAADIDLVEYIAAAGFLQRSVETEWPTEVEQLTYDLSDFLDQNSPQKQNQDEGDGGGDESDGAGGPDEGIGSGDGQSQSSTGSESDGAENGSESGSEGDKSDNSGESDGAENGSESGSEGDKSDNSGESDGAENGSGGESDGGDAQDGADGASDAGSGQGQPDVGEDPQGGSQGGAPSKPPKHNGDDFVGNPNPIPTDLFEGFDGDEGAMSGTAKDGGFDPMAELAKMIRDASSDAAVNRKQKGRAYWASAVEDVTILSTDLGSKGPQVKSSYRNLRDRGRAATNGIRARLVALITARRDVRTIRDQESGAIDRQALPSLVMGGNRNVFERRSVGRDVNTAITILVDESGSMAQRIKLAQQATISISEACDAIPNLSFEIIGFTAQFGAKYPASAFGGNAVKAEQRIRELERLGPGARITQNHVASAYLRATGKGRYGRTVHTVYKSFDEQFKNVRDGLALMSSKWNNADGDSLIFAARRIMEIPVDRRIIMVLSDGQPNASGTDDDRQRLRNAISEVERAGIEIAAIGIQSDAPRQYYKNYEIVKDLGQLPKASMRLFRKLILGKDRRAA